MDEVKLLGIQIDNKLNFKNYFNILSKKVNTKLYCIKRLRFLPHHVKVMFFKSFILPHFDYCSSLFVYFSATLINQIEKLFDTVVYKLFNIDLKPLSLLDQSYNLKFMNIMPYKYRLFYRFCIFSFKIMNGIFLNNINDTLALKPNLVDSDRVLKCDMNKFVEIVISRTVSGDRKLSLFLSKFINKFLKNSFLESFIPFKRYIMNNIDENVKVFEECLPKKT